MKCWVRGELGDVHGNRKVDVQGEVRVKVSFSLPLTVMICLPNQMVIKTKSNFFNLGRLLHFFSSL